MGDIVKIAVKAALIAVVMVAIVVLFATISIPSLQFGELINGVSKAMAILYHWCPGARVVVPFAIGLLGFIVAYFAFRFAMVAVRWIFKVNE